MSRRKNEKQILTRRDLVKSIGLAPLLLRAAPFCGSSLLFGFPLPAENRDRAFPFCDVRLTPHYPAKSPLADILRLVPPGSDEYVTEKYAFEIESLLNQWSQSLRTSVHDLSALTNFLSPSIEASSLVPTKEFSLRSAYGIDIKRRSFTTTMLPRRERFLQEIQTWLGQLSRVETAEFEIYSLEVLANTPLAVRLEIRYDI